MLISLRRQLRRHRSNLSPSVQASASRAVVTRLLSLPICGACKHIAIYSPVQGEIDITSLTKQLPNAFFYFPVMSDSPGIMHFYPVESLAHLRPNRFGIPEPIPGSLPPIAPHELDLVLLPLVAFDLAGHRLGAGGGYYDRYLSFTVNRSIKSRPVLLGIAYDFQAQEELISTDTDVPVDGVITESSLHIFTPKDADGVNLLYANG